MAYLVHPDKLTAAQNIVTKQKAKSPYRPAAQKKQPAQKEPTAQGGNMLLRLAQRMYIQRQAKLGGRL